MGRRETGWGEEFEVPLQPQDGLGPDMGHGRVLKNFRRSEHEQNQVDAMLARKNHRSLREQEQNQNLSTFSVGPIKGTRRTYRSWFSPH